MNDILYETAKAEQPFASDEEIRDEMHRVAEYVSEFDDVYDLWEDIDSRGHTDGNFKLEDIYGGKPLDCQGRANAVALYEELVGAEPEVELVLQYNKDSLLGMNLTTDGHITPSVDGDNLDTISGRSRFETAGTERIPALQTLGMGYETFEEEKGSNLPASYLKGQAEELIQEENQKNFVDQSEVILSQANAMKKSARIASLPGPLSKILNLA